MLKKAGVAILGLGVVGGGTYEILTQKREYFKKTQGVDLTVEAVLEKNRERAISLGVEESKIAGSIEEVVSNPNVDIVVEVIGGTKPAYDFAAALCMPSVPLLCLPDSAPAGGAFPAPAAFLPAPWEYNQYLHILLTN